MPMSHKPPRWVRVKTRAPTPFERESPSRSQPSHMAHLDKTHSILFRTERYSQTLPTRTSILQVFREGERRDSNPRPPRHNVENLVAHMIRQGKSPATARHTLSVLHSIFEHARRQEGIVSNPASLADKPRAPQVDPDIRFLENEEVEALVRSVPDDYLGRIERPLYLTATMTVMRQGKLLAPRWRDVDWQAQRTYPTQLRARRVRHAEVQALLAERAARRPARR